MRHQYLPLAIAAFVLSGLLSAPSSRADQPTTVILVRHAEKDRSNPEDRDPRLTDAGHERAQELVQLLGDVGIDAVYATPYRRTRDTARPLADHLGLELLKAPVGDHATNMAKLVREDHAGQTVLVVGHSDTTPPLARALGAVSPPIIEDHVYDELWILILPPGEGAPAQMLRLHYGAPTPDPEDASGDDAETNPTS